MTNTRSVPVTVGVMNALSRRRKSDYNVLTSDLRGGRVRAKLVQIGNSRGVRLPKAVIEEANLGDEVELIVRKDEVVLRRVKKVREGWAEDAKHRAKHEPPGTWPTMYPTHFHLHEHEWPMEDFGE